MGKKSNVFLTTLGCVALASSMTAGSAFAVADVSGGNITVASELVPLNAVFNVPAVNVAYEPGGALANGTQLKISLAGGNFNPASPVAICSGLASFGNGTVPASPNNGSVIVTVSTPFGQGTTVSLQNNGNCGVPAPLSNVNVNAGASAGSVVGITVDNNLNLGDIDVFATEDIVSIQNQFTATITKVDSNLDFATNQQTFLVGGGAAPPRTNTTTTSQAALLISSNESLGNKVAVTPVGACVDTLAAPDVMNLEVTGDLTGLSALSYGLPAAPGTTVAITPADVTAGKVTLPIPGTSLRICRSTNTTNTASADELTSGNTTSIVTGVRVSKLSLSGAGQFGAGNVATLVTADSHDFNLDATTFFVPLIKQDSANGVDTFIKLNSSSTLAGANGVSGVILTDDGTYATCSFGTITPGTAFVISGSDWASCVTTAGKTVNLAAGSSSKVIVNAPQANVQGLTNLAQLGVVQRVPMQILGAARGE